MKGVVLNQIDSHLLGILVVASWAIAAIFGTFVSSNNVSKMNGE